MHGNDAKLFLYNNVVIIITLYCVCACFLSSFRSLTLISNRSGYSRKPPVVIWFRVPAYAAAKGALGQLTKALSNEWSQHNVQVNGICPGYIATDMNEKLLADPVRLRQISERIPAGRWGQPVDFAGPVVFLASSASQYVCGELLVVDGGWMGR